MKIACCGSSGGGKTTLTTALSTRLDLPAILYSRPTRAAQRMGYTKASEVPNGRMRLFQWYSMFEQLHSERSVLLDPYAEGFVSDRSTLDFAAYYLYQAGGIWGDDYVAMAIDHAHSYDLLIHVPPPTWPLEDNGIRHLYGVKEADLWLMQLFGLGDLGRRVIHLAATTPEARVDEVLAELKKRGLA